MLDFLAISVPFAPEVGVDFAGEVVGRVFLLELGFVAHSGIVLAFDGDDIHVILAAQVNVVDREVFHGSDLSGARA